MTIFLGHGATVGSNHCGIALMLLGVLNVMPYCGLASGHDGDHETTIKFGDGSEYRVQWHGPTA